MKYLNSTVLTRLLSALSSFEYKLVSWEKCLLSSAAYYRTLSSNFYPQHYQNKN